MSSLAIPVAAHSNMMWDLELDETVVDMDICEQTNQLACMDAAGKLSVVDIATGALIWDDTAHVFAGTGVKWSADGKFIATTGYDKTLCLFNMNSRTAKPVDVNAVPTALTWHGEQLTVALGTTAVLFNADGQKLKSYSPHRSTITDMHWQGKSGKLVTCSYKSLQLSGNGATRTLPCLGSLIRVASSPNGRYIAAGSQDRILHLWDLKPKKPTHMKMQGYPEKVAHMAWSTNNRKLATAGGDTIVVWDISGKGPTGSKPTLLEGHDNRITAMTHVAAQDYIISGDRTGRLNVWSFSSQGTPVKSFETDSEITGIRVSSEQNVCLVGNENGQLKAYKLAD